MNSGALVKVDTKGSWMERALGARGARLLLVAGGTIALTLSVPTALLEDVATASGLSELSALFAPPIGLGSRLLIGSVLALLPVGVVWALWGPLPAQAEPLPDDDADFLEIEDEDEMMHARTQIAASTTPWGALIRLVRGDFQEDARARATSLNRRRRDRHPDAPPRPPLSASRDLPPHVGAPAITESTPLPAAQDIDYPRTFAAAVDMLMPRAPAPLTDEEIAQAMADSPPRSAPAPRALFRRDASTDEMLRALDLPLIADTPLAKLAARFEGGVAKREAVVHAREAQQSLSSSIAFVQPDPSVRAALRAQRPVEIVPPSARLSPDEADASLLRADEDVEEALSSALATLRRLTEQGRR